MQLSGEQQRALAAIEKWHASRSRPWFYLAGHAGAGKSTLALEAATRIGGAVKFGAFTGMAARVMRAKGCVGATTLHQLMYQPLSKDSGKLEKMVAELAEEESREDPNPATVADLGRKIAAERELLRSPSFSLRENVELRDANLVIVDEVSMVSERLALDLLSFEVPVLVLGDPGQLPPVKGTGFFSCKSPDYTLEEIHRQAAGSPIIQLATAIRSGESLVPREWGPGCRVIERGVLTLPALVENFDQIICGTNAKRAALNSRIRSDYLGREGLLPLRGDRVVCRKNNHERGLLNGSQGIVQDAEVIDDDQMWLGVTEDTGTFHEVICWRHLFEGREKELPHFAWSEAELFDHAYVITGHRSQGSQWSRVCVIDQGHVFRQDADKWRYTCATRAEDELTVIL